jgi:hypothetical protein
LLTRFATGEWEYDFESLPPLEKERPYTPPREEPIEYLIEELKIIWEPRIIDVSSGNVVTVTPASATEPSKAEQNKKKMKADEDKSAEDKQEKVVVIYTPILQASTDHSIPDTEGR